jgi:Cu/Ag efflux pump CusA
MVAKITRGIGANEIASENGRLRSYVQANVQDRDLGGMISSLLHILIVTPVIFLWLRERELRKGRLSLGD